MLQKNKCKRFNTAEIIVEGVIVQYKKPLDLDTSIVEVSISSITFARREEEIKFVYCQTLFIR